MEKKFEFENFNIEVEDNLWIAAIGLFDSFNKVDFMGKDVITSKMGDGTIYQEGYSFNVSSGKYLLSIEGYQHIEKQKFPSPNYGFYFSLVKTNEFVGYRDPRQYEKYSFNPGKN